MLALALASYLSLYPVLLLPPLILLCFDRQSNGRGSGSNAASFAALHSAFFAGGASLLLYMSYLTTGGSWEFLSSTYGVHLLLPDLTPNVGLWWYFFIEMFDSFREFFLGVFWLHLGGYVGGLCFRVRKQPLFVVTTLLGLFAIFKPYPSISDTSLYFAFLPLYRHIFPCKSILTFQAQVYRRAVLTSSSDALYLLCRCDAPIRHPPRTGLLLPLDICRLRECQLLLCHYARLELRSVGDSGRLTVRSASRRVGSRAARDERERCQADIEIMPIQAFYPQTLSG